MAFRKNVQLVYFLLIFAVFVVFTVLIYFFIPTVWIIRINESMHGTEFYVQNYTCQGSVTKSGIKEQEKNKSISSRNGTELTTPNKWITLVTVNIAFFDIFENWWKHFRTLNITVNITIIAEDEHVFKRLMEQYKNENIKIVRSWVLDISASLKMGNSVYNKMVSTRPTYILKYLEECFNVIYCDIDTVWLKSPFPYFKGSYDMWAQTEDNGNRICSGFMAVRSNTRTVTLIKRWIYVLAWRNQRNQPALNDIIRISDIAISHLDEKQKFVGGPTFSEMTEQSRSEVVVLHATFSKGREQKVACFKEWHLWKM